MKRLMILLAVAAATSPLWAIQGTIHTATDSKKGDIKWQGRSKSYAISFKKGNTMVSAEYPIGDVEELDIEKPAGYDKAVENVKRGNGAAAIGVLTKIVQDYKMLQWDKPAGRYLVEAYLAANRVDDAFKTAQGIISDDKAAAYSGELAPAYWQTLLKLGKNNQLESCLKKAAASSDRATSAEALIMRGDIILNEGGDSQEALRQALTDGYLRVALMYPDAPGPRAAAMNRAAACFDKLGMAARAESLRTQAKAL